MTARSPALIYDLDYKGLAASSVLAGEPPFRADQIWKGIYQRLYSSFDQFSNLPATLRRLLQKSYSFSNLAPVKSLVSSDGETSKTLFALENKLAIETVLMRYHERRTLCISTQAGCAMGCVFCATGQMGFRRNLSSGEIIEQVIYFARQLAGNGEHLTNIVLMGMGEPFHNYDASMAAIDRLNDPNGFNMGARRFTISTVGLVPMIERFTHEDRQINLAVSLHAADNDTRSALLPVNRKYPLEMLLEACLEYTNQTKRRITFEWALIDGVNDNHLHAEKLASILKPFVKVGISLCHVNVIPLNPTKKFTGKATSRAKAYIFRDRLVAKGIPCTVRVRRGIDIHAGCGQLAAG